MRYVFVLIGALLFTATVCYGSEAVRVQAPGVQVVVPTAPSPSTPVPAPQYMVPGPVYVVPAPRMYMLPPPQPVAVSRIRYWTPLRDFLFGTHRVWYAYPQPQETQR